MGDRMQYLSEARHAIERNCGKIADQSAVYETAAWGMREQPAFLNQALLLLTHLTPLELLQSLLALEESLGRKREIKYGPRIIDIDILLFNDDIIHTLPLKIPHPELPNRRFALQCLHDIAPETTHPVLNKTVSQLLAECTDPLTVNKFN